MHHISFHHRLAAACAVALLAACGYGPAQVTPPDGVSPTKPSGRAEDTALFTDEKTSRIFAEIETSKGTVEAELDYKRAPLTTLNFIGLAEGNLPFQNRPAGKPFYDGQTFHRVVPGFVVQGGDPFSADPAFPADKLGDGGPGYSFPDEFVPGLRHDAAGVLSMANDGPDTNGSQFFITLDATERLNYLHSVFGQVVRGLDVLKKIEPGDRILHVTVRRHGPEAEAFAADQAHFEKLRETVQAARRPAAPDGFTYLVDETKQLPDFRAKNFNYKLANYERTTGHRLAVRLLPEFRAEPPEQSLGNAAKQMAAAAGITDAGDNLLAVCFVSQKTWSLRLGEATYPSLLGATGTTAELMASGALHQGKQAIVQQARERLEEGKLKESVDALLDTLILKFDEAASKHGATPPP